MTVCNTTNWLQGGPKGCDFENAERTLLTLDVDENKVCFMYRTGTLVYCTGTFMWGTVRYKNNAWQSVPLVIIQRTFKIGVIGQNST